MAEADQFAEETANHVSWTNFPRSVVSSKDERGTRKFAQLSRVQLHRLLCFRKPLEKTFQISHMTWCHWPKVRLDQDLYALMEKSG